MEFSSRISAKDYRAALRLKRKNLYRVIYAVLTTGLVFLFVGVATQTTGKDGNVSQFLVQAPVLLGWSLLMAILLPLMGRLSYRKNKNIQAEFNNSVTESGFSYKSSSGSSGEAPWSSFSYWRESRTILLLVFPSNIFLICPKSCLSPTQLEEFKTILTKVLPKK